MCVLAKFQLPILKAFEVTFLQNSSNRKINLYSRQNKLQALTKMDVTHKWSKVWTQNLHHRVCHELRNGLLGKLFFLLPIHHHKQSRNPWRNTDCKQPLFDVTWTSGHNLQFLQPSTERCWVLIGGMILI